jgi:hypothetical protein
MVWLYFVFVLGAIVFGRQAVTAVEDFTTRGRRLSHSPPLNAAGQVDRDPAYLKADAEQIVGRFIEDDAYAIARMLRSEGGSGSPDEKRARAWVARNDAAAHGWSMLYTIAGPDRLFGRQRGWRYASGEDPWENDLAIAEAVLDGRLLDNTGGAVKFVDIKSFGAQEGTGSYETTLAQWRSEGLSPRKIAGAADDFRVFVRDGGQSDEDA